MPKTSKRDTLLGYFLSGSNWHSLYIRVEKLGLLGFIFHLGPMEPSVKLKKIKRNQGRLGLSESYDPTNLERLQKSLKDPDCFW